MNESELLSRIAERSRDLHGAGAIVLGPGDDAAVLRFAGTILATVDHLVEGRHYDAASTSVDDIARKAIARSVSDIAAMGGMPECALATGCLPPGFAHADELFDRMSAWARRWKCPLAGGDIAAAPGPLVLTVTVLGRPHSGRGPVPRSGAIPGDSVFVTGAIGGSLASGRHLRFEPRLDEASWLCDTLGERLHAMIDVSDGLGRDAGRIARSSGVRIEIDATRLPLQEDVRSWRSAAADGEDYELLFTAAGELPERCPGTNVRFTRVGRVVPGSGCVILEPTGEPIPADTLGWEHRG